jgi:curved DNA-binding protein CbpA
MDTFSDIASCYQILGLLSDATEQEIKLAYRQLARRYHPDVNPGDHHAEARFKQIALAYQTLITAVKQLPKAANTESSSAQPNPTTSTPAQSNSSSSPPQAASERIRFHVKHPDQSKVTPPELSPQEKWLKLRSLNQVYSLMKRGKWQQVLKLAERLAARFPGDSDVYQWQALAYHGWARQLLDRKRYDQARIYLKKALQTDPHNRKLWEKIEQDYRRMERQLQL